MTRRQVASNHLGERWVRLSGQPLLPPWVLEHSLGGFGDEIVFRRELAVEAAVGQPGALHNVRDSDSFKTTLTEERARHVENLLAIRLCLLARHPHCLPPCLDTHLTIYMMGVINGIR